MGLFSKKKKIYVSSVSYNLAGDIKDRVKYLPTAVMSHVIKNSASDSLAESITQSLMSGPGIKFRGFGRWARNSGYTTSVGQSPGRLLVGSNLDLDALTPLIPRNPGETITIQTAEISGAEYDYWVDQYMLDNHPTEVEADYEVDFKEDENTIYINFLDGSGKVYSFQPVGFDPYGEYLYVSYTIGKQNQLGPVVPGTPVVVTSPADFPSTSGMISDGESTPAGSGQVGQVKTTTVTYSDGRPGSVTTDDARTPYSWTNSIKSYHNDVYRGQDTVADQTYSDRSLLELRTIGAIGSTTSSTTNTENIGGGVTKTTVVQTANYTYAVGYSYVESSQKLIHFSWSKMQLIIYKKGTGNAAFDAFFVADTDTGAYLPFIPMRINNSFVSGAQKVRNRQALKKATGASYDKVQSTVANNSSLGDIDYAYILFGVALNTKEPAGMKYLFKFFELVLEAGAGGGAAFTAWQVKWNQADTSRKAWLAWKAGQTDPTNPLFGAPQPTLMPYPQVSGSSLRLYSRRYNLNITIRWNSITKTSGVGRGWKGARSGQAKMMLGATKDFNEVLYTNGLTGSRPYSSSLVTIIWQLGEDHYETMAIWGLQHTNIIYKGKGVNISASEAMRDGDESGFIIPLNEEVYRLLPLTESTQMANAMAYMVFNCYKVVKQKWYQTKWFKIILIVVIIVVSILYPPAGAAGAGILGPAAAVGAAIGFAGVAAIVVGTIANAIAAMILSQIIMTASVALFGEKVGAIVGAIASVVAVSVGTSMANGGGIAAGFSNLSSAENLMRLTVAAGQGISGYMNAETQDTIAATQKLMEDYEAQSKKISELWEMNLGNGRTYIDPIEMTDLLKAPDQEYVGETVAMFLGRTLMTGTDIAQTTHNMLTNMSAITISTQLPV